jgi:hypothetical protein
MKMQQNLRQQQFRVDQLKNHFKASQAVYHNEKGKLKQNRLHRERLRADGEI